MKGFIIIAIALVVFTGFVRSQDRFHPRRRQDLSPSARRRQEVLNAARRRQEAIESARRREYAIRGRRRELDIIPLPFPLRRRQGNLGSAKRRELDVVPLPYPQGSIGIANRREMILPPLPLRRRQGNLGSIKRRELDVVPLPHPQGSIGIAKRRQMMPPPLSLPRREGNLGSAKLREVDIEHLPYQWDGDLPYPVPARRRQIGLVPPVVLPLPLSRRQGEIGSVRQGNNLKYDPSARRRRTDLGRKLFFLPRNRKYFLKKWHPTRRG